MTELVSKEGALLLLTKDRSERIMTNYVPKIIAVVKTVGVTEGVLVEHAPKGTSAEMKW